MTKLDLIPADFVSIGLSVALTVLLWRLDVANVGPDIVAGLLLELVLVTHRMLGRVGEFSRLLGQISSVSDLREIISHLNELSKDNRRFTKLILQTITRNFLLQTSQLRHGRQNMSPDQFMVLARTIYSNLGPNDTLFATSYFGGGDYWTTKYGAEYAALNRQASAQGAKINRIYILRDRRQLSEKEAVLRSQSSYSNVFVLVLDEVPVADSDQRDFLVVNDAVAAEFHFAGGQVLSSIDVLLEDNTVQELCTLMRKLEKNSMSFETKASA